MKCLAMPRVLSYRDLIVWQKSIELVLEIYRATQDFPKARDLRIGFSIETSSGFRS